MRALERYQTNGVIKAVEPRRGNHPSRFDVLDVARRVIAHRAQESPHDRREGAQAQLLELRFKRESRELVARDEVIRAGLRVAKTVTAYLTTIPLRMVKDGVIAPEHEAAVDGYIRERLDELSRLADETYLAGDDA